MNAADDLPRALALFAPRARRDALAQAAVGKNGAEGALVIADAYRAFAKAHPGMYGATLRAARPDDEALQRVARDILDIVKAVFTPFGFDDDTSIHAIRGFRSLVHGFVSLEAAHAFGLRQNVDESFAFIVRSFLAGIDNDRSLARG